MRRHGSLFARIVDLDNLRDAYRKARRGKTWQRQIREFDSDVEGKLLEIQRSLVQQTFRISPYQTRIVCEPKKREIYVLPFVDRVVQHALMNIVEPIWEGLFIADSYACRKGKGVHAGSRRTMEFVRCNRYCLKCDISKFYPSIDHDILFAIIQKKIKCPGALWLLRDIVYSAGGGKNAPIGNYTSQWFGNLYLNELDQHVKHIWRVTDYVRYCDDFVFFHDDKSFLATIKKNLAQFLSEKLLLSMSACELFPVSQGVDFLGYRHFRDYLLVRKRTAKRMMRRVRRLPDLLAKDRITRDQLRSSLASIEGWLRWANAHNLARKLGIQGLRDTFCA